MEDSANAYATALEQEIFWTVSFLRDIQNLVHQDAAKVRTIQTLIEETSRISPATPELLPR